MRANLLGFRFLLRLRVSITMQLQQCYGMPLRRRAATATATATALQYVTFRFATENLLFPQVYETLHAQEKTILL